MSSRSMIRHHPECERGLFVQLKEELHAMRQETDTTDITNKQFILQLDLESVSYANLQLLFQYCPGIYLTILMSLLLRVLF